MKKYFFDNPHRLTVYSDKTEPFIKSDDNNEHNMVEMTTHNTMNDMESNFTNSSGTTIREQGDEITEMDPKYTKSYNLDKYKDSDDVQTVPFSVTTTDNDHRHSGFQRVSKLFSEDYD